MAFTLAWPRILSFNDCKTVWVLISELLVGIIHLRSPDSESLRLGKNQCLRGGRGQLVRWLCYASGPARSFVQESAMIPIFNVARAGSIECAKRKARKSSRPIAVAPAWDEKIAGVSYA